MKYYIYISDSKLDMLFHQVSTEIKEKIASEWKLDLKVFSVSRESETEIPANRYARLQAVVDFISHYGDVGSVDEPGEYIRDTLLLKCGLYEDIVYFGGATEDTVVGLAGSARHVIGNLGASEASVWPPSFYPYILKRLGERFNLDQDAMDAIFDASTVMGGSEQRFEFLAKRLACGPSSRWKAENRKVLLATPIYVAMAE
jgi:uncharacterized protein DUF7019